MAKQKIRVLIVDDSASVRQVLGTILAEDPEIEVIGTASDPFVAAKRLQNELPDVILLDIEMPRMDGMTFLRKIMAQHPIPVVICSSLTPEGSDLMFEAFEAGAVDIVPKPRIDTRQALMESSGRLREAIKSAARARVRPRAARKVIEQKLTADAIIPPPVAGRSRPTTERIVCIGVSTGGTEALYDVLEVLPPNCPGILIVQHMPQGFTAAFAKRLNAGCQINVKEAEDGDPVLPGWAYIAPGARHMLLVRSGLRYQIAIKDGPPVSRHRPSADVLFRSAAQYAGANALGIIMTGMGDDGARGLLEMRKLGAYTCAQDEESCVVFGMPKEAIACGAVEKVVSLNQIPREIMAWQQAKQPASAD
ncbi:MULTISPECIES: chemotaxis response regulator protein-glutamate methylesterase [Rhodopseudomonas]|jgi:two-component system chemotaxis response regulator CheB|uniref:Protein-glutamate methylesterase/protein-glutamine glutaminase n=1 Tax=Rhodopseudomonas palustris TaxID=1076 RepID=A0AAX3DYZ7_RHOPL|nr:MULTISPECIES: chemotaxis response regulator protein-glutamate methylesterase [Rhodopseudomonas]AVT74196.1 chemotaxis response regulator protein-glutamate methylesterase [Rhodopseudomonas palustris]NEV79888.1 chemotaxis response regulator protein-glutamate methylesterase [Rhodopseudomonas sp. BR0C11]NEW98189.1 chemotaxis response regulator protein-glutamate methylesterase [Rhodopseudomonas sp. BR0G17]UYO39856.1 chemotaxis response regulator protein-glutamate methylesterase [Rhodopseudomonas p